MNGRQKSTGIGCECERTARANDLAAKFPGVNFNFSQYIQDNVEEAVSGVKGENSVKLIGNDVVVLTETAEKIKATMSKVRGVADLAVFTSLGQPTLRIDIDRKAAARYAFAAAILEAPCSRPSARLPKKCCCPQAIAWNGSANLAIFRMQSNASG